MKPTYEQLEQKVKELEYRLEYLNNSVADNLKLMDKVFPLYRQNNPYKVMWFRLRKFLIKLTKDFEKENNDYARLFNINFMAVILKMSYLEEDTFKKFYRNKLGNEDEIPQE